MNDYISIISSLVIFLFPYLGRKWFNSQLLSSTVVSLGLLGTFGGIMYGLWVFSVEQIDSSIPQLLEGLKTAFLTSIAGMLASLLLKLVPTFYGIGKEEKQEEEITEKQFLDLLISIEKNTRSNISSEFIQEIITSSQLNCNTEIQDTLSKLQETLKDIGTFLSKSNNLNMKQNHTFVEQVTSFGEFIKGSEQQMSLQLNRMEEKYERELTELEKFTKTLMTIVKKLSQDHDTLYKKTNEVE